MDRPPDNVFARAGWCMPQSFPTLRAIASAVVVGIVPIALSGCAICGFPAQGISTVPQAFPIPPSMLAKAHAGKRPGWMRLAPDLVDSGSLTYVSEMWGTTVDAYRAHNRKDSGPVCEVGPVRIPEGMGVDSSGTLYVVTHFQSGIGVATFGPNCGKAGPTFTNPSGIPDDLAIDGDALYLTQTSNRIEVYNVKRGQAPIRKLSDGSVAEGIGLATDSRHDLFWSTLAEGWMQGQVVLFPKGEMPGHVLNSTKIGHDFPGGVLLDRSDNLLLIDQTESAIYIYAAPYDKPPFSVIPLKGAAVYCALTPSQDFLLCMDYQYGAVDAYKYPAGRYLYSYTNGIETKDEPIGIAIQRDPAHPIRD